MNVGAAQISDKRSFRWSWLGVYFLAALLVTHIFAHSANGLESSARASLHDMVTGTAFRPFVGRMLMPWLIGHIDAWTPQVIQDSFWLILGHTGFSNEFINFDYQEFVFLVLSILMFTACGVYARRAYAICFGANPLESSIAALIYVIALPLWFRYFNYVYDPATIFFATVLAYAIVAKRDWLFGVMFILACINKETAVLALPVWAYARFIAGHKTLSVSGFAVLGIVYLAIRHAIDVKFQHNLGTALETHFADHQMLLLSKYVGTFVYAVIVMFVFLALSLWRWREKPLVLRAGFIFTLLPLIALSIPFGYIDEIRALYDAYPYVLLLGLPTLLEMMAIRPPARGEPVPAT